MGSEMCIRDRYKFIFAVDPYKEELGRGEELSIRFTVRGNMGDEYWIRTLIIGPMKIYPLEDLQVTLGSSEATYSLSWVIPDEALPGTYSVIAFLYDIDPGRSDAKVIADYALPYIFAVDRGISYIEITGSTPQLLGINLPERRIVHIHLTNEDLTKVSSKSSSITCCVVFGSWFFCQGHLNFIINLHSFIYYLLSVSGNIILPLGYIKLFTSFFKYAIAL